MRKILKKLLVVVFAFTLPALAACGGGGDNGGDKIYLKVDMQSYNPSFNSTPTLEQPIVVQSTKILAEAFMEQHENIVVEFDYSKSNSADQVEASQWFINGISSNNLPAIAFSWGTAYQERDYYVDLTEYFNQPNPYVEGNEKWRDLYYDHIFYQDNIIDAKGRIVAVPFTCSPGAQTGFYYNKEFFKAPYGNNEEGYDFPQTWEEFINVANAITNSNEGIGFASWPIEKQITLSAWFVNQNLAPSFIQANDDEYGYDYDDNGTVTTEEQLRGVKDGLYNPATNEVARELFRQIKRYYTTSGDYVGPLNKAWQDADYTGSWTSGAVAILEDGAWSYQSVLNQAGRSYDFGYVQPILIESDTTEYALDTVEMTESGPDSPDCNFMLNIMKPAVEGKPELLDAAVKFLQFMSTPESLSMIATESGSVLPAAKDGTHSPLLDPIIDQPFPKVIKAKWPMGFTTSENDKIDRAFVQWLNGEISESDFYTLYNRYQNDGADKYISAMNIDTSAW